MFSRSSRRVSALAAVLLASSAYTAHAQTTLGGITGTVTDVQGSIVPGTTIVLINNDTGLKRTQTAGTDGSYNFADLPIGPYTLTFTREGFETSRFPSIAVQADRTVTLPAQLKIGAVSESVTVDATPLLNAGRHHQRLRAR